MPDKPLRILGVFLSLGTGIRTWEQKGHLPRMLHYFSFLGEHFDRIGFFTYDQGNAPILPEKRMTVYSGPEKTTCPNFFYALLMPFRHWKRIRALSVLLVHQMSGALPALIAKLLTGKPLVVQCGYSWSLFAAYGKEPALRRFMIGVIERAAFSLADCIIVTEEAQADIARRYHRKKNIHVIPNGVDTSRFRPAHDPGDNGRLLFIGRLTRQKNLFSLIKAVSLCRSIPLDVIGGGELEKNLKAFAASLHAPVHFLGSMPNDALAQTIPRYRALVLPSFYEGDPKAAIEAMACGIPVIATRVPGNRELIIDGKTGFLTDVDAASLAAAIAAVWQDPQRGRDVGASARAYIERCRDLKQNLTAQRMLIDALCSP